MSKAWRPKIAASRHPRILEGEARATAIARTAEILGTWTLTRFEREAVCRHALRRSLVLQGHRWPLADLEAASIVSAALNAIGARRPTWEQGQREYTTPRENCSWCGSDLDAEQMAMGDRFCSSVCAKAAIVYRDFETRAWDDELGRRAYYILARAHLPRKNCLHCGRNFQPTAEDGDYCSRICRRHSRGDILPDLDCPTCGETFHPRVAEQIYCSQHCAAIASRTLEDRECPNCSTVFHPRNADQLYCSHQCSVAHKPAALGRRHCAECGSEFYPRHETALYCSERCNGRAKEARKKAARHALLVDRQCPCCGKTFTPKRRDSRFCSERCSKKSARLAATRARDPTAA